MLRDEQGFTFPLSLCLLLLFSTFLIIHTELYLNEKRIYHETETILKQEYCFLSAVRRLEEQMEINGTIGTGIYFLQDGTISYQEEDMGNTTKINLTLSLQSGEQGIAFLYFDKSSKKLIRWVEKN